MKTLVTCLLIIICFLMLNPLNAQLRIGNKIDTSQANLYAQCKFIRAFMNQDSVSRTMWLPKYANKKVFDYNMDWNWQENTPKKLCEKFDVSILELQLINDTLSYFKLLSKTKPIDKNTKIYVNIYKYYMVKVGDKYYIDNCKEYDSKKFSPYKTRNITFYVSPLLTVPKLRMDSSSDSLELLYDKLQLGKSKRHIEYYMCSSEEELNNLSNIITWNGGLTGYTNIPDGYVFGINSNPLYEHEFIHAILGASANCFFSQEGIATLYGGLNKSQTTYFQGKKQLKEGYIQKKYTFENLYKREISAQFNSTLTYTFAAVLCEYVIKKYGLSFFYRLYYDQEISTSNFIDKLSTYTGESTDNLKMAIEEIILK